MTDNDLEYTKTWLEIHLFSFREAKKLLLANIEKATGLSGRIAKQFQEFANIVIDLANIASWVKNAHRAKKMELYQRARDSIVRMKELAEIFERRHQAVQTLKALARRKTLPRV